MSRMVELICPDCGNARIVPVSKQSARCRACNNRLMNERKKGKTTWFIHAPCVDCGTLRRVAKTKVHTRCRRCDCAIKAKLYPTPAKHGHCANSSATRTFVTWRSAKIRCYDPANPSYPHYGAVGIGMCDRWRNSFENFLADMGARPPGMTLERLDNRKGYEPGNCTWATPREQALNKRSTVWVELSGEKMPLVHAAARLGMTYGMARDRSLNGALPRVPNPYAEAA